MAQTPITAEDVLSFLRKMNHHSMLDVVAALDKLPVTELHNVISKVNVLRALSSLAIQDAKFPIKQ